MKPSSLLVICAAVVEVQGLAVKRNDNTVKTGEVTKFLVPKGGVVTDTSVGTDNYFGRVQNPQWDMIKDLRCGWWKVLCQISNVCSQTKWLENECEGTKRRSRNRYEEAKIAWINGEMDRDMGHDP